jgi:hypothetical protein
LFDFKPTPLKCLGDQIPSGGHSGEERVERSQIIAVNPDFHRMAVRLLCDDREMESELPQKSMVLGSKNRREFGSSTYGISIRVPDCTEAPKLGNESSNQGNSLISSEWFYRIYGVLRWLDLLTTVRTFTKTLNTTEFADLNSNLFRILITKCQGAEIPFAKAPTSSFNSFTSPFFARRTISQSVCWPGTLNILPISHFF